MKKWNILIITFLLMASLVVASQDAIITFTPNDNITINSFCYNSIYQTCNSSYECYLTTYYLNDSLNYSELNMTFIGGGYFEGNIGYYEEEGDYKGFIKCESPLANESAGLSRADFRISSASIKTISEGFNMLGLIFIPILLSAICLIGATSLGKDHEVLKIFLYLLSFAPIFFGLHLGTLSISDTEIGNSLAQATGWLGWIYIVIITYFLIYLIVKIVASIQAKKAESLRY